ncbi:hypothetical protein GCM10009425_44790 [Pseudomonas asuensis]|uniref:Uncharacterized protein n=1 Tax=Pseudomonas asuensis TaxID=1825787 RepID=A0ABQ2H473_9PSED|nr:hypothetical protein GCM10009425_44790 [Pseudomonas asuensis]
MLATTLVESLRRKTVLLPSPGIIERICSEAITRANRCVYNRATVAALTTFSSDGTTWLACLRQSPVKPNSRHMLEHIERPKAWQA